MNNVKVGDWVVNAQVDDDLTVGKRYKVKEVFDIYIGIIDDVGDENELLEGNYELAPRKYRNPPREEYRELCEALLAGADLCLVDDEGLIGQPLIGITFNLGPEQMCINPESILPQPDERKERIKQQLLKIDADKLAQLIIDAGIEL